MRADDDEEDAHQAHHGFGGQDFADLGGEGRGDDAPENEAGDDGQIF